MPQQRQSFPRAENPKSEIRNSFESPVQEAVQGEHGASYFPDLQAQAGVDAELDREVDRR